jgi:hypothetical protein
VSAYRDKPIEERVTRLEDAWESVEGNARRISWADLLQRHYVPQFVGVMILAASIFGIVVYANSCSRAQTQEERAYAEAHPETDPSVQRAVRGCQDLCESMGLLGGVIMEFTGTRSSDEPAYRDHCYARRTGHSCICGNGMGGSVRIDPDGLQTAAAAHPAGCGRGSRAVTVLAAVIAKEKRARKCIGSGALVPIFSVALDKKSLCGVCGRRVGVLGPRGRFARHNKEPRS